MQHKITIHENLTLATNLVSTNYTDSDMVRPKMGKCAVLGKKRPSAGSQFLFSNVFFFGGGGAKWCFDWYFSLFK